MSRIRTIKPEFWTDDLIGSLSRDTRLLFIGSWNLADDEGRLRWSAPYLKGAVFPFDDDIGVGDVEGMMIGLVEAGLVISYVGGRSQQRLGFIRNFARHQRINRPTPSKLPAPPDESMRDESGEDITTNSLNDALNDAATPSRNAVATTSMLEGEEEREQGRNDLSLRSRSAHAKASEGEQIGPELIPFGKALLRLGDFALFWAAYPHKVGKGTAESVFAKVVKARIVDIDTLLAGINRYRATKPVDRPWCNPSTWLNGKRWLDEADVPLSRWAQTA